MQGGFYWIKWKKFVRDDGWQPAEWNPGGWVEGADGIWYLVGSEVPIYEPEDLAEVTVGPRLEPPA